MTIAIKYELEGIGGRFSPGDVVNEFHYGGRVRVTAYDDVTLQVKGVWHDNPEEPWANLSVPLRSTLITLRDQSIAGLKIRYNTQLVTVYTGSIP